MISEENIFGENTIEEPVEEPVNQVEKTTSGVKPRSETLENIVDEILGEITDIVIKHNVLASLRLLTDYFKHGVIDEEELTKEVCEIVKLILEMRFNIAERETVDHYTDRIVRVIKLNTLTQRLLPSRRKVFTTRTPLF